MDSTFKKYITKKLKLGWASHSTPYENPTFEFLHLF